MWDRTCTVTPELTFLASNTQWLRPSSSTWFHHLKPTISLPVMFCKHTSDLTPAQHQQSLLSTRDTHLYRPEVTGQQEDYRHHGGDEAAANDLAEQVHEDGGHSEEEVEEGRHGMPGTDHQLSVYHHTWL